MDSLTPNVLRDHNVVSSSSFDPFHTSSDGFLVVLTTSLVHVHVCYVLSRDSFDSTYLAKFGLIQIWECALNWFTMELIHKLKLDIYHLHSLGATYPKNVFIVDPYVQMIPNWSTNL
jgi:hypothetical protein